MVVRHAHMLVHFGYEGIQLVLGTLAAHSVERKPSLADWKLALNAG